MVLDDPRSALFESQHKKSLASVPVLTAPVSCRNQILTSAITGFLDVVRASSGEGQFVKLLS